jgi:hypothetical protein
MTIALPPIEQQQEARETPVKFQPTKEPYLFLTRRLSRRAKVLFERKTATWNERQALPVYLVIGNKRNASVHRNLSTVWTVTLVNFFGERIGRK